MFTVIFDEELKQANKHPVNLSRQKEWICMTSHIIFVDFNKMHQILSNNYAELYVFHKIYDHF